MLRASRSTVSRHSRARPKSPAAVSTRRCAVRATTWNKGSRCASAALTAVLARWPASNSLPDSMRMRTCVASVDIVSKGISPETFAIGVSTRGSASAARPCQKRHRASAASLHRDVGDSSSPPASRSARSRASASGRRPASMRARASQTRARRPVFPGTASDASAALVNARSASSAWPPQRALSPPSRRAALRHAALQSRRQSPGAIRSRTEACDRWASGTSAPPGRDCRGVSGPRLPRRPRRTPARRALRPRGSDCRCAAAALRRPPQSSRPPRPPTTAPPRGRRERRSPRARASSAAQPRHPRRPASDATKRA